jgi:hypothetical protein
MAKYCVLNENVAVTHSTPLGVLHVVSTFAADALRQQQAVADQKSVAAEVGLNGFQHCGAAALQRGSDGRSEIFRATSTLRMCTIGARQRQEVGIVTADAGGRDAGGHHVIANLPERTVVPDDDGQAQLQLNRRRQLLRCKLKSKVTSQRKRRPPAARARRSSSSWSTPQPLASDASTGVLARISMGTESVFACATAVRIFVRPRPRNNERGSRPAAGPRKSIGGKTRILLVTHQDVPQTGKRESPIELEVVYSRDTEHGVDAVGCEQRDNVSSD